MPYLYIRTYLYIPRRTRGAGPASTLLEQLTPISISGTGQAAAQRAASTIQVGDRQANFAFWSITGGAGGNQLVRTMLPPAVDQQGMDVTYTAWYILPGSGPGDGVLLDAWDLDANAPIEDPDLVFIKYIAPVPAGTSLAQVNRDGVVPTTTAEQVLAEDTIYNGRQHFKRWDVMVGNENSNGTELLLAQGSAAICFAVYELPTSPTYVPRHDALVALYVSAGVKVGGDGVVIMPGGVYHVPPRGPARALLVAVQLLAAEEGADAAVRAEVRALAARQVEAAQQQLKRSGGH